MTRSREAMLPRPRLCCCCCCNLANRRNDRSSRSRLQPRVGERDLGRREGEGDAVSRVH